MSRYLIASAIAALSIGSFAQAEAQTQQCRDDRAAGAIAGAIVGGVTGGVIANDRRGFRRGFRGHRGYYGGGFRRGYRRGNNGAGIVIGALAGGLIGSQLANTSRNCTYQNRGYAPQPQHGYNNNGYNTQQTGHYGNQGYQNSGRVLSGGPSYGQQTVSHGQTECRMTERYINLPDGSQAIEPIQVCRDLPNGAWVVTQSDY